MTERKDGDRIIITGYSGGSHFPRQQELLNFDWEADGTSEEGPFNLEGSVYGKNIRFNGPGLIRGAVLGRGDILLDNNTNKIQSFMGGIKTASNIISKSDDKGLQNSLVGDIQKARFVFRGDVIGQNVVLENAIVFGRVYGQNIKVQQSIIFGAAIAEDKLTVTASTLMYYSSKEIEFEGPCVFLNAMGESEREPIMVPYQDATGFIWKSDLLFYPAYRDYEIHTPMTNRVWENNDGKYDRAKLFADSDWVLVPVKTKITRMIDGKLKEEYVEGERFILSIAGRCLNFEQVNNMYRKFFTLIKTGLEYFHYNHNNRREIKRMWDNMKITSDEKYILNLITEPVIL